jgi:hypothetical protein
MKKMVLVSCLLFSVIVSSYGQWYLKKYNVTDINSLSRDQLEESYLQSKNDLLISGIVAVTGGVITALFRYGKPGMSEDPGFVEELIGDEGVNTIGFYVGLGILAGGTIASTVFLGRMGSIKSAVRRNYACIDRVNISPVAIYNSYTKSLTPGFTLTYSF